MNRWSTLCESNACKTRCGPSPAAKCPHSIVPRSVAYEPFTTIDDEQKCKNGDRASFAFAAQDRHSGKQRKQQETYRDHVTNPIVEPCYSTTGNHAIQPSEPRDSTMEPRHRHQNHALSLLKIHHFNIISRSETFTSKPNSRRLSAIYQSQSQYHYATRPDLTYLRQEHGGTLLSCHALLLADSLIPITLCSLFCISI